MAKARYKPPALSFERTRYQLQKIRGRLALARFNRTLYRCEEQVGHRAQLLGARPARQESNEEVH
ncbi:hypothetical protein SAMN02990966_07678 [Rhodospirillales bacterium URHD0017]|nr:hypothetical protein SAMN02990966_07678 [Rhodospirillales bacterium URHD0017]